MEKQEILKVLGSQVPEQMIEELQRVDMTDEGVTGALLESGIGHRACRQIMKHIGETMDEQITEDEAVLRMLSVVCAMFMRGLHLGLLLDRSGKVA